jgi:hypothetical protein
MKRLLALLVLLAAAALPAEEKVVGGPYVIHATGTSATVAWVVQTGEEEAGGVLGVGARKEPLLDVRTMPLTKLKPGARVSFNLPFGEESAVSFQTAPERSGRFQAVVYGDTRTRHDLHRKVAAAIAGSSPDILFHTGDLVSNGHEASQWPIFFDIEKELLRKAAFFPVLGNHERNDPLYYKFFGVTTPYYSLDWGSAHFIITNSDVGNAARTEAERDAYWAAQTKWLEADLAASSKAPLVFVISHHPPFTAVRGRQDDSHPIRNWAPLFARYGVTALFSGHDHNYQHHVVDGVHYIVTGGGGAPLYDVDAPMEGRTLKVEKTEHFVRVLVDGPKARAEAVALDGHMIDSFEFPARRTAAK